MPGVRDSFAILFLPVLLLLSTGCVQNRVTQPDEYIAPYREPVRWAVVPFEDQTTTYDVDGTRFASMIVRQLQETEGVSAVPMADTASALRRLGLLQVTNQGEAMALIRELNVDGVIAGGITNWDPYEPLKFGTQSRLYVLKRRDATNLDPRRMEAAGSANSLPTAERNRAISEVMMYLEATDGRTLKRLKDYSRGRVSEEAPEGWRSSLVSMERFEMFAAHELIRRTFAKEWQRLYGQQNNSE